MPDSAWAFRRVVHDREEFAAAVLVPVWLVCDLCRSPCGIRPPRPVHGVGLDRQTGALVILAKTARMQRRGADDVGTPNADPELSDDVAYGFTHVPGFVFIAGKAVFACPWHGPASEEGSEATGQKAGPSPRVLQLTPENLMKLVNGCTDAGQPVTFKFREIENLIGGR